MPAIWFYLFALQKKRKKKREKKREKKKEKKRFPIKGAKLIQLGKEIFHLKERKNGKIVVVVQTMTSKEFSKVYANFKNNETSKVSECSRLL